MSCNNQARGLNYTQRIIQGESFNKQYTGEDTDVSTGDSIPLDLSNKTIKGQIRPSADSDTVVEFLTSTSDSGTGTVDTFSLILTSSQTAAMQDGTWVYDVDAIDNTDAEVVDTLLKGNFVIRAQVSK